MAPYQSIKSTRLTCSRVMSEKQVFVESLLFEKITNHLFKLPFIYSKSLIWCDKTGLSLVNQFIHAVMRFVSLLCNCHIFWMSVVIMFVARVVTVVMVFSMTMIMPISVTVVMFMAMIMVICVQGFRIVLMLMSVLTHFITNFFLHFGFDHFLLVMCFMKGVQQMVARQCLLDVSQKLFDFVNIFYLFLFDIFEKSLLGTLKFKTHYSIYEKLYIKCCFIDP